jgi:hypothetical protein
MPTYTETVEQVTDQYLTALTAAQDAVVETVSTVVEKLPKPGETAPAFDVPAFDVPAGVPTVEELNAASFAAVEAVVANQKAFAEKFLAAAKA